MTNNRCLRYSPFAWCCGLESILLSCANLVADRYHSDFQTTGTVMSRSGCVRKTGPVLWLQATHVRVRLCIVVLQILIACQSGRALPCDNKLYFSPTRDIIHLSRTLRYALFVCQIVRSKYPFVGDEANFCAIIFVVAILNYKPWPKVHDGIRTARLVLPLCCNSRDNA